MKSILLMISSLLTGCALVLISCSKGLDYEPEPPDPYFELRQQIAKSPRADGEAELMALWMSGSVVAYQRDYDRVRDALALVREIYADTVPFLDSAEFVYRMQESVIGIGLTESAIERLRAGTYIEWDSLNELYRLSDIDTSRMAVSRQVELSFEGRLNPSLLSTYYGQLDGVSESYLYVQIGDYSNIYPWQVDYNYTFLLREAHGDCMFQCDSNQFWYFRVSDGEAEYIGKYLPGGASVPPAWWDQARVPFCRYIRHSLCYQ